MQGHPKTSSCVLLGSPPAPCLCQKQNPFAKDVTELSAGHVKAHDQIDVRMALEVLQFPKVCEPELHHLAHRGPSQTQLHHSQVILSMLYLFIHNVFAVLTCLMSAHSLKGWRGPFMTLKWKGGICLRERRWQLILWEERNVIVGTFKAYIKLGFFPPSLPCFIKWSAQSSQPCGLPGALHMTVIRKQQHTSVQ